MLSNYDALECFLEHMYNLIVLIFLTSGVVTEEEVEESSYVDVSTVTNFTAGSHFLEQVEDAKDSVWLVQVHSDQNPFNHVINTCWKAIKYKMDRFGVRVGHFDCKLDRRCLISSFFGKLLVLLNNSSK